MADGGRIGLYAGKSLPDGGCSFTLIVCKTKCYALRLLDDQGQWVPFANFKKGELRHLFFSHKTLELTLNWRCKIRCRNLYKLH